MELSQDDLWTLRGLIQKTGWGSFMSHIGSLMAEQADKVQRDSTQDTALFRASTFIHCDEASKLWNECGTFDYYTNCQTPEEYKELLSKCKYTGE